MDIEKTGAENEIEETGAEVETQETEKEEETTYTFPESRVCIKTFSPRSSRIVVDGVDISHAREFTYHVKGGEDPTLTVTFKVDNLSIFGEVPDYMK